MSEWVEQIERRARMIHEEIASWRQRARELNFDPELACENLYKILDVLYQEDMPLAKAKDDSDLLLHIEGKAVSKLPTISLVSSIFNDVKFRVRDLTKVISGIRHDKRFTVQDIDLGLSGLARGSLFVGFSVPLPKDRPGDGGLFGEADPLYRATKEALKVINTVSHIVAESDEFSTTEQIAQKVDDPKIRDAALVAVRSLAPSGRRGIESIGITGSTDENGPADLTPAIRSQLGRILREPVISQEEIELRGVVREIDLDARRFDLRRVANAEAQDVRCSYSLVEDIQPRSLLDAEVVVTGRIERRGADHAPRLMSIKDIRVIKRPPTS